MKPPRLVQILAAIGFAMASTLAAAQAYPSRPVTVTVPFAAGGPTDTIARIMAERMSRALGQTVVVENVTGAGGSIAGNKVAHAAPDGYSVTIGHIGTHVIIGAVQKMSYDVFNDFEPVAMIASMNGAMFSLCRISASASRNRSSTMASDSSALK